MYIYIWWITYIFVFVLVCVVKSSWFIPSIDSELFSKWSATITSFVLFFHFPLLSFILALLWKYNAFIYKCKMQCIKRKLLRKCIQYFTFSFDLLSLRYEINNHRKAVIRHFSDSLNSWFITNKINAISLNFPRFSVRQFSHSQPLENVLFNSSQP